ncbi:MAG: Ig-like domain-containing protein [bacterium]|nr:Ig-like domain-containing protein [bacterium]
MLPKFFVAALLILISLVGCSADSTAPPGSQARAPLTLTPADGTTNVQLDAPVTLAFAVAVDRAVVERDMHLISEFDLMNAACPDSAMAPHGDMMTVMADSLTMRHLDEAHATDITYEWNADGTECTVRPAAWLRPQTRYMVHVNREMSEMMQSRMDSIGGMGGMGGHGSGDTGADMMFHFTTMDTSGGGHLGHH